MISFSTDKKEIQKFGLIAFIFFGVLCCLAIWRGKDMAVIIFGILSLIGICFLFMPEIFRPAYYKWLRIAHVVGRIITLIILTLAYFIVLTPSAILKRLFGGVPMPIKPDKTKLSYWVTRDKPIQPRDRFTKRF